MVETKEKYTKKDKQIKAIIDECLEHSNLYSEDRKKNWELYEGIRAKQGKRETDFDHVYKSHIGANSVEQLATYATQALTNEGGKIFRVAEYNNIELADQAKAATVLLNYYMGNINVQEELYKTLFEAECFGTGIIEVEHRTLYTEEPDPESRTFKMSVDDKNNFKAISSTKWIQKPYLSQPMLRQVRVIDFWADKQATSMKDLRYACVREIMNFKEVEAMKDAYGFSNLERAKTAGLPVRDSLKVDNSVRAGHRKRDTSYDVDAINIYNESNAGKENPKVEIIRVFRPGTIQFVMNGVVISDKLKIYDGVRFPFILFRNDPKPGEFYGRSSIELIRNDIEFHEEMVDLIHDQTLLSGKSIFLADANAFTAQQLKEYKKAKSGDIVPINGLNIEAMREVKAQPPNQTLFNMASTFEQNAKNSLSINPMIDGGNELPSGVRTQGAFELMSRMGTTRLQNKIKLYAKSFEEVGKIVLQIAKVYATEEIYLSVTGSLGDTLEGFIDPRSINTGVKFKVQLGSIADPARISKMAQQINWAQTMASLDPHGVFRMYQALAEAAVTGDLFEDPTALFETDPEAIQAKAQLAALSAGKQQPTASNFGSYQSEAPQPPQQQMPQGTQQGIQGEPNPAQASSIPTMGEGR